MSRSNFGTVRKLQSGRFQARYVGPDEVRRTAGSFKTKREALLALAAVQTDIATQGEAWKAPGTDKAHDQQTLLQKFADSLGMTVGSPAFGKFAVDTLAMRAGDLAPRTLEGYESMLKNYLLPSFEGPLSQITVQRVDKWWAEMGKTTGKVNRRNCYFLLSNILKQAVRYHHIPASPCIVKGAGKTVAQPRPFLSVDDFRKIVAAAPDSLSAPLWTLLGAHVRLGELVGLNVGDIDLETGRITVNKQSQEVRGQGVVTRPTKTGQGRTIKVLTPAMDVLREYMKDNTDGPDEPLFRGPKGGRLSRGYLRSQWLKACEDTKLAHAHIHDLRHTGLTFVAAFGTTAEVMERGGHSSVAAAMKYQHATRDRVSVVADLASAAMG